MVGYMKASASVPLAAVSYEELTSHSKVHLFPCVGFHNSMLEKERRRALL